MKKKATNNRCTNCKHCETARFIRMPGDGPADAEMMIIGEAPGETEDETGRPFTGRTGKYLRRNMFLAAGIDESEVRITNAVRCRPKNNKTPSIRDIRACREHLISEVRKVNPKVCVLVGNVPLASVLYLDKVQGINKWHGKVLWSRELNCWVVPTYHPSGVLREKNMGSMYRHKLAVDDLELAVQVMTRKPNFPALPKAQLLKTPEQLQSYLRVVLQRKIVSVDLETDRFDPRNDILGVSMCFKKGGKYWPVYIEWKTLQRDGANWNLFRELMASKTVVKLTWNMGFEEKFLRFHKAPIGGIDYDVMIAAHLLDENFSAGLKENTWRYLGFGGYDLALDKYKVEHKFTKTTSYKKIPLEILWKYGAMDALATFMLWEKFELRLEEEGMTHLFKDILCPARRVMVDAECTGFPVDLIHAADLKKRCEKSLEVLEQKIYEIAGRKFNIRSGRELATILFDELGLKSYSMTATGQRSTDKDALAYVAKQKKSGAKLAKCLVNYKYVQKMLKTYITPAQKWMWNDDGKVHSSFNMVGTVTGRTSNSNPCTHNIPKDKLIRSMYCASPGNVLIEADLKAAELRVLAMMSGEPVLLDAFARGIDPHDQTYRTMFDKSETYKPSQTERDLAKRTGFGLVYGISPQGLARTANVSVEKAENFMKRYFDRLPAVKKFMRQLVRDARKLGYVVSIFGRKRRLPDIHSDDEQVVRRVARQAQNAPIQTGSAEYTYILLIRVSRMLKKSGLLAKIIHTVHDCLIVDTPENEVEEVTALIEEQSAKPVKGFTIPMAVDIKVVRAWGEHNESKLELLFNELKV